LGAASNVVILEAVERKYGVTFTFKEFVKNVAIVTAANMLIRVFFIIFPF